MTTVPYHWSYGPDDAPLLLCLHGIGSCADAFVSQIPAAAASERRIVAWDAPGYRNSADPDPGSGDGPGIDGWADAVADLIEHLGADRADVLGVSWGGVTATRLALRHPARVRSLILADSSPGAGVNPEAAESMRSRAGALTEVGPETFARERTPLLVNAEADAELLDSVATMMIDSVRMPSYQWACNSMAEADHRPDLPSIDVPTLVVVGDEDRVTGLAAAEALADGIPGAELAVIDAAGHLANQERPEAFNEVLVRFLTGVPTD
ncbi:MAG: alpha/beta fold hydrolase [Actinomycetota bacterium]